jgi:hypothetical protein
MDITDTVELCTNANTNCTIGENVIVVARVCS